MIIFEHRPQVHLNFYSIFTIEKVAIAFTASKALIKRLAYDYGKDQDVLSEARDFIAKGFKDLKEFQDSLTAKNRVLDVDGSDILDINAGGSIISVTRGTLTQIKGTRLEALFSGRWDRRLPRDDDGRVFLDVNPKCFGVVVDYLNESRITPPDCSQKILHLGEGLLFFF